MTADQALADARWTADVFAQVLGQIALPVKMSDSMTLSGEKAARPDGLLPVFLLEAASIWETVNGERIQAGLVSDPQAVLGVRAQGLLSIAPMPGEPADQPGPPLPVAVTLACLTEAAHAVQDGQHIRADLLLNRWQMRLEEFRQKPQPQRRPSGED